MIYLYYSSFGWKWLEISFFPYSKNKDSIHEDKWNKEIGDNNDDHLKMDAHNRMVGNIL